jgi:hypothetical protein
MKYINLLSAAAAAFATSAAAVSVSGSAEGFAKGVTGGGSATAVYPDTISELVSYLGDDEARVIVLTKTCVFKSLFSSKSNRITVSIFATVRVPPPVPVVLLGVLPLPVRLLSIRTAGVKTTNLLPLQFPSPSRFHLSPTFLGAHYFQ